MSRPELRTSLRIRAECKLVDAERVRFKIQVKVLGDRYQHYHDSITSLAEQLRSLPCAALYPDLTNAAIPILERWQNKLPTHCWHRFVKVPQTAAFGVPRAAALILTSSNALRTRSRTQR